MKGFECVSDYLLLYTLKTRQMRSNLCNLKQNQSQDYSTGKWPNEMLPTFAEEALIGKNCTRIFGTFFFIFEGFFYF
jgi:hypothetical protein